MLRLDTKTQYIKKIFSIFIFSVFFISYSSPVYSQTLQFDQRCFIESDCTELRTSMGVFNPEEGFVTNEQSDVACTGAQAMNPGEVLGFCIAGGKIETTNSFGGKRNFDDITDFITYIFRFSFSIAIALAVVMILVSGIQWMTSGGNSSVIDDAKKRIQNTILGLFLLTMSYTILNTINPALVRFRPLDIYMLNPITLAPEYCTDLEDTPPLYLASHNGNLNITPISEIDTSNSITVDAAGCGNQYYIANAGEQTCQGSFCPNSTQTCVPITLTGNTINFDQYSCINKEYILKIEINSINELVRQQASDALGRLVTLLTDTLNGSNWLANNAVKVFPVCRYITTDYIPSEMIPYQSTGVANRMMDPISISSNQLQLIEYPSTDELNPLSEYYILLEDLTPSLSSACNTLNEGRASSSGQSVQLLGYILQLQLDSSNAASFDHDLFLGQNGVIDTTLTNIVVMGTYFTLQNPTQGASIIPYNITEEHLRNSYNYRQDACFFNNREQEYPAACGDLP